MFWENTPVVTLPMFLTYFAGSARENYKTATHASHGYYGGGTNHLYAVSGSAVLSLSIGGQAAALASSVWPINIAAGRQGTESLINKGFKYGCFSIAHLYPDLLNLYGDRGNLPAGSKNALVDMIAGSRIFTWEIAWIIRVWICCLWVEDQIGNRGWYIKTWSSVRTAC